MCKGQKEGKTCSCCNVEYPDSEPNYPDIIALDGQQLGEEH